MGDEGPKTLGLVASFPSKPPMSPQCRGEEEQSLPGEGISNFNPDWLLGNLSILQLRRRKPSKGICSQVIHM